MTGPYCWLTPLPPITSTVQYILKAFTQCLLTLYLLLIHSSPSRLFESFDPRVKTKSTSDAQLDWPISDLVPSPTHLDSDLLSLKCGDTFCKFRASCYRCYIEPNPEDEWESSEEEEEEEGEDETDGKGEKVEEKGEEVSTKLGSLKAPAEKSGPVGEELKLLPKTMNVMADMEEGRLGKEGGSEETAMFFPPGEEEEGGDGGDTVGLV